MTKTMAKRMGRTVKCAKHTWGTEVVWGKVTCGVCGKKMSTDLLDKLAKARKMAIQVRAQRSESGMEAFYDGSGTVQYRPKATPKEVVAVAAETVVFSMGWLAEALVAAIKEDGGAMSLRELRRVVGRVDDAVINRMLDKLVKSGTLAKTVKKEWDKAGGYAVNMFGGSAVCVRRRAYYGLAKEVK